MWHCLQARAERVPSLPAALSRVNEGQARGLVARPQILVGRGVVGSRISASFLYASKA